MSDEKLPYTLYWKYQLANPSGERRTLAIALIDAFIHWASRDDLIEWSPKNSRAHSGLVRHPRDNSLHIDLQSTSLDRARPGRRWAHFMLVDGERGGPVFNNYAVLELECGLLYAANDVRTAWLASLSNGLNATMLWSPSAFHLRVLDALRDDEPRTPAEIVNALSPADPIDDEPLPPLIDRVNGALPALVAADLVAAQVSEDRPDLGNCYMRKAKAVPFEPLRDQDE